MTISIFLRLACAVAVAVSITAQRTSVQAQQRAGTAAERESPADQQRRQSLSRHPRLGAAHSGEKAVGRIQRRGHR